MTQPRELTTYERERSERLNKWRKPLLTRRDRWGAWLNMFFADHGFIRLFYLNLHRISPHAWRSAQPAPYQIRRLARQGLKSVINLLHSHNPGKYQIGKGVMESSLILVIVLICVVVFVVRNRRTEPSQSASVEPSPQSEVGPFDPEHRKPVSEELIVKGPARIIDGDTLVIRKTQIRLFGIDAPEIDHPYGQKAKWALVALCKGQPVRAEITDKDDFGRTVARCTLLDGRDLSAEMVKLGLAIDWPKYSGGQYLAFETPDARKKLWLADARQKGRMHVWKQFEAQRTKRDST